MGLTDHRERKGHLVSTYKHRIVTFGFPFFIREASKISLPFADYIMECKSDGNASK